MSASGVTRPNLDKLLLADELVANREANTGVIPMARIAQQLASTGPLAGVEGAVETAGRATPQYATVAEAQSLIVPPMLTQTLIEGDIYYKVTVNPYTKRAYQDASGAWFSSIKIRTDGPIEVWVAWGQSEMRGVTGSPGTVSGRRSAESYVLVYARGLQGRDGLPDLQDGWYAVGPEDVAFAFYTSLIPVGAVWYKSAAARARAFTTWPGSTSISGGPSSVGAAKALWRRPRSCPLR